MDHVSVSSHMFYTKLNEMKCINEEIMELIYPENSFSPVQSNTR